MSNDRRPCYERSMQQTAMRFPGKHGGKRDGAGRPKITHRRASEPHVQRPSVSRHKPLHVVIRAVRGIHLRSGRVYQAIRQAMQHSLSRAIRIVHLSIQATHVHLIVEAENKRVLAKGMQGFQVSAARRINAALGRTGTVFADRYHATVLGSPRQVRNTLAYVLNNWRKHGEHEKPIAARWTKDPFSTAIAFDGWMELAGKRPANPYPGRYAPLPIKKPVTWLLRVGWRRHGSISLDEVPGSAQVE